MRKLKLFWLIPLLVSLFVFLPLPDLFADPKSENFEETLVKKAEEQKESVKIAVFGDIMMHGPQIKAGQNGDNYDFTHFFTDIKPYLESADLAIGNLELTMVGPSVPYNGYPTFNSPDEIVDALLKSGVDAVSTANNHSMDQKENGVLRTREILEKKGLKGFGTARSQEERDTPLIIEKNGVKMAFLAYTQHTNGIPVPEAKSYLVNRIDPQLIEQDIKKAKEKGAEFISVSLHWGDEYQREPNQFQKETAMKVLEAGADVIVGSHPHVVQPMEKVKVDGKDKLIIYSLGNFISNQTPAAVHSDHVQEGLIVYYDIERDPSTKEVLLKDVSFLPTYAHIYEKDGKRQYTVLPLDKEVPEKLPNYPQLTESVWRKAYTNTYNHIAPEEAFPVFSLE